MRAQGSSGRSGEGSALRPPRQAPPSGAKASPVRPRLSKAKSAERRHRSAEAAARAAVAVDLFGVGIALIASSTGS